MSESAFNFDAAACSVAPDLLKKISTVPMPKKIAIEKKSTIPKCLQLSEASRQAIQEHIETLGIDLQRFEHNLKEQGMILCEF